MRVLVVNGPNLNLLGQREPSIYGTTGLDDLIYMLDGHGRELGMLVEHVQSNSEGELIDILHRAMDCYDGIILNPGAYTHYSYAIRDAVAAIGIPVVEVHISNINARMSFAVLQSLLPYALDR